MLTLRWWVWERKTLVQISSDDISCRLKVAGTQFKNCLTSCIFQVSASSRAVPSIRFRSSGVLTLLLHSVPSPSQTVSCGAYAPDLWTQIYLFSYYVQVSEVVRCLASDREFRPFRFPKYRAVPSIGSRVRTPFSTFSVVVAIARQSNSVHH